MDRTRAQRAGQTGVEWAMVLGVVLVVSLVLISFLGWTPVMGGQAGRIRDSQAYWSGQARPLQVTDWELRAQNASPNASLSLALRNTGPGSVRIRSLNLGTGAFDRVYDAAGTYLGSAQALDLVLLEGDSLILVLTQNSTSAGAVALPAAYEINLSIGYDGATSGIVQTGRMPLVGRTLIAASAPSNPTTSCSGVTCGSACCASGQFCNTTTNVCMSDKACTSTATFDASKQVCQDNCDATSAYCTASCQCAYKDSLKCSEAKAGFDETTMICEDNCGDLNPRLMCGNTNCSCCLPKGSECTPGLTYPMVCCEGSYCTPDKKCEEIDSRCCMTSGARYGTEKLCCEYTQYAQDEKCIRRCEEGWSACTIQSGAFTRCCDPDTICMVKDGSCQPAEKCNSEQLCGRSCCESGQFCYDNQCIDSLPSDPYCPYANVP